MNGYLLESGQCVIFPGLWCDSIVCAIYGFSTGDLVFSTTWYVLYGLLVCGVVPLFAARSGSRRLTLGPSGLSGRLGFSLGIS